MDYSYGNNIPASKAIRHMRFRLSAKPVSAMGDQRNFFENTDKVIEHLRSRLKATSQQREGDMVCRHG